MTSYNLQPDSKVYVAGHCGMVGSAVIRALQSRGITNLVTRTRAELDLTDQAAVEAFFQSERPDVVIFAAARVGGIHANKTYPAEFAYENLAMSTNAIHAAYRSGVKRFLFLGSTCIYPRDCPQPIREEYLLTGPLEPTNEAYALAKIAGLKLCQYYRRQYGALFHSAMPTNLYGPGDNYHPENSHVLPALIRRFHEAKTHGIDKVVVWGSGQPRREFLYVSDLAEALIHLLHVEEPPDWVNVGTGNDMTISEVADTLADVIGYSGAIEFDETRPDGTKRKCTDCTQINSLGWRAQTGLRHGIHLSYEAFMTSWSAQTLRVN